MDTGSRGAAPELAKADVKPYDKVKNQLRNELMRQQMDKQTTLWLDELRRKARVHEPMVMSHQHEPPDHMYPYRRRLRDAPVGIHQTFTRDQLIDRMPSGVE